MSVKRPAAWHFRLTTAPGAFTLERQILTICSSQDSRNTIDNAIASANAQFGDQEDLRDDVE